MLFYRLYINERYKKLPKVKAIKQINYDTFNSNIGDIRKGLLKNYVTQHF